MRRPFILVLATTVLACGILGVAPVRSAEEPPPQFQASWNSCDFDPCYPVGLGADGAGNLYVVDLWNNRVRIFAPGGSPAGQWGSEGNGDGQLSGAQGLAVDGSGNVHVADTGNHRVQKFSSSGSFLWAAGTGDGSAGTGDGEFDTPGDLAVDAAGNVYVVDRGNNRIQKLSASGGYLTKWGGAGSSLGQFSIPRGIGVTGSGTVYVADSQNNRVQRFEADGTGAAVFVPPGVNEGQVADPARIDVDAAGNVYVVDRGACTKSCRVQKFSPLGVLLSVWGGDASGCQGAECDGKFLTALDVAVSDIGSIYVSDLSPIDPVIQGRIQQFVSTVPVRATTWGRLKALYP